MSKTSESDSPLLAQYSFALVIDSENDMRYTCGICHVTEYGGSLGNPGLYGRMHAHLTEGHDVDRRSKRSVTLIRIGHNVYDVLMNLSAPSPAPRADESSLPAEVSQPVDQWMPKRSIYREFIVDTNCVNARQKLPPMNRLEAWAEEDVIRLLTTEIAQHEMLAGGDSLRAAKAYSQIFTMSAITTESERQLLNRIERILCPNGMANANQRNDAEIVFNAAKYMRPLITTDGGSKTQPGGILGNRTRLFELGARVLSPAEAVEEVECEIAFRDQSARQMASTLNLTVPEWVGKD